MKKFKILLGLLAFVLGVSAAVASQLFSPVNGYSKQTDYPGQGQACQLRSTNTCDSNGSITCTYVDENVPEGITLFDSSCSNALQRIP